MLNESDGWNLSVRGDQPRSKTISAAAGLVQETPSETREIEMQRLFKDRTGTLQVSQSVPEPYRTRSRKDDGQRLSKAFRRSFARSLGEVTDTRFMKLLIIRIHFRLAAIEYLLDSSAGAGPVDSPGRRKAMRSKSLVARRNTKRRPWSAEARSAAQAYAADLNIDRGIPGRV